MELRDLTAVAAIVNAVYLGQIAVLVVLAQTELGATPTAYGAMLAAGAIGGVGGGLLAARVARLLGRGTTLAGGLALLGIAAFVTATAQSLVVVAVTYAAAGFLLMVWSVVAVSARQAVAPAHILGRVTGVYRLIAWGTMPLGALVFLAVSEFGGPRTAFALGGVVLLTVTLAFTPRLRRMDWLVMSGSAGVGT